MFRAHRPTMNTHVSWCFTDYSRHNMNTSGDVQIRSNPKTQVRKWLIFDGVPSPIRWYQECDATQSAYEPFVQTHSLRLTSKVQPHAWLSLWGSGNPPSPSLHLSQSIFFSHSLLILIHEQLWWWKQSNVANVANGCDSHSHINPP